MTCLSLHHYLRTKTALSIALSLPVLSVISLPVSSFEAKAQTIQFSKPYEDSQGDIFKNNTPKSDPEHLIARGRRAPPKGYKDTPDDEIQYGADPDHIVHRDNTTGADLDKFGTAYQESSPMQTGELGDATGNGWTAPRGNGW